MGLAMVLRTLLLFTIFSLSTAATKKDLCRKYEGAYISYYEHVFLVKGCQRHAISAQEKLYTLTRNGVVFQAVDAVVIRNIPLADKSKQKKTKNFLAKTLPIATRTLHYPFVCRYLLRQ